LTELGPVNALSLTVRIKGITKRSVYISYIILCFHSPQFPIIYSH